MSPCGTFALIGSAGGAVDMYNLQSGQHRRRFPTRLTQAEAKKLKLQQLEAGHTIVDTDQDSLPKFAKGQGKHKGAVTGIAVDSLNRVMISSGDDGKVKVGYITRVEEHHAHMLHSFGTSILASSCTKLTGIP